MGIPGRTSTTAAATAPPTVRTGTTEGTAPVPGKVYLRRPTGEPAARPLPGAAGTAGTAAHAGGAVGAGASGRTGVDGAPNTPGVAARAAVTAEIARLLTWWLEAYDGRRPVAVLRRGPYAPGVLEELRTQIRDAPERRHGVPSRLLRVHLPPSHRQRLAFTASAAVDGRVRAIVGHLVRRGSRWRVEGVTLVV